MIPGQRRPTPAETTTHHGVATSAAFPRASPGAGPVAGDLYFDPDVPEAERVVVSCGAWSSPATHVWTGSGWSRLNTAPVRPVPGAVAGAVASTVAGPLS